MTNREIAQEISNRIGTAPVPFDSVYSIALQIYNELGGEQTQFDSVYSILLEILPLVEGGIKPIEEVSELPNVSENKDKLFRLDNGDKDVYAAKLLSSETITTNRLPDEQQIDKAYIQLYSDSYHYKGLYHCKFTDTTVDYYCWFATYYDDDMERDITDVYLTYDNAETISNSTLAYYYGGDMASFLDEEDKEIDFEAAGNIPSSLLDFTAISEGGNAYVVPAIYNAPESAQIGNAYVTDDGDTSYIYDGTEITLVVSDGQFIVYRWYDSEGSFFSTKQASNIYYAIKNDGDAQGYISDVKFVGEWDLESFAKSGNTYTNTSISYSEIDWYFLTNMGATDFYIPQLNAPDSEQVGNAYIEVFFSPASYTYLDYSGEIYTIRLSDNSKEVQVYWWNKRNETSFNFEQTELFTLVSAENIYGNSQKVYFGISDDEGYVTVSGNIITINTELMDDIVFDTLENAMYLNQEDTATLHTVKYQRTETIEEWGWEKVATEDDVNDLSDALELKANKVDYIVPLTLDTETYEYVPDYSVLNSATTDGSYTLKYVFTQNNVDTTVAYGNLQVSQGGMLQTIHYFNGMLTYTMRMHQSNQWMTLQEFTIPCIWQSNIGKSISSYSAEKVDELIASLEARIAALEGN